MRKEPEQRISKKDKTRCSVKYCRSQRHQRRLVCARHAMLAWRAANPVTELLNTIRCRARRKGISFSLTLAGFKRFCAESGWNAGAGLHVDRIDCCGGYHISNIQVLGGGENIAKGNRERHSARYQEYLARRKAGEAEMDCPF